MRKVVTPIFQILLRHHDDGRAAQGAGWANDSFADGPEHSGFRNVQKAAQFAHADERQNVTGFFDFDSHNAEVGVSTRTKRTIRSKASKVPAPNLPAGLVELPGDLLGGARGRRATVAPLLFCLSLSRDTPTLRCRNPNNPRLIYQRGWLRVRVIHW